MNVIKKQTLHASRFTLHDTKGLTLVEVILSVGLTSILFGGIIFAFFSILNVIQNSSVRGEALAIISREIEIVRNVPFDQVGTIGGIPSGILPQQKVVTSTTGNAFTVVATVRNIDDPFDGTIGGIPIDTAPADYKQVEFNVTCSSCLNMVSVGMTTIVAPKNLESSSATGSLFVNVVDAGGQAVPEATVHVVNASVTPAIDLLDTTNQLGILQLVGVATSTQGYHIDVTKLGYSLDRTYPVGDILNPDPIVPDATVVQGTLTQTTFAIDRVSTLKINTSDMFCVSIPNRSFTIQGAKLIGATPSVLKFSTSSATDAEGQKIFPSLEWDTYTLIPASSTYDLIGAIPLSPLAVNPSSSINFSFILATSSFSRSLLVTVRDGGTGQGIASGTVTLSKGVFVKTLITGRNIVSDTDWSGGNYTSENGEMDPNSVPGTLSLLLGADGYSTTTTGVLVSRTFDMGSNISSYFTIGWNPVSQPTETGPESIKFQIATNNDNATWNFVGPDGDASSYYVASGTIPLIHSGNRYLRYKVIMSTLDSEFTPSLDDVQIEFSGPCVPPAQAFFGGLGAGSHMVTVSAEGYQTATSSVSIGPGSNALDILLSP